MVPTPAVAGCSTAEFAHFCGALSSKRRIGRNSTRCFGYSWLDTINDSHHHQVYAPRHQFPRGGTCSRRKTEVHFPRLAEFPFQIASGQAARSRPPDSSLNTHFSYVRILLVRVNRGPDSSDPKGESLVYRLSQSSFFVRSQIPLKKLDYNQTKRSSLEKSPLSGTDVGTAGRLVPMQPSTDKEKPITKNQPQGLNGNGPSLERGPRWRSS